MGQALSDRSRSTLPVDAEETDMFPDLERTRPFPGSISVEHEGDVHVLCLRGEVDTAVAERFKQAQGRRPAVVDAIDAAGVSFISSTGLAVLVRCAEASLAAGRGLVLRASSPALDRILRYTGLQGTFPRPPATPGRADTPG
jgi:anti-anti-sigma factor